MSHVSQRLLDDLLFSHFQADKHLLGKTPEAFSETMIEVNDALLPPASRTQLLSRQADDVKRMEVNGKALRRYHDERDRNRMPAELVLLFVTTVCHLDAGSGVRLKTTIARELLGSLYVPIPDVAARGDIGRLARLAREFSDVVTLMAPILEDGQVDSKDAPLVPAVVEQIDDLIAAAIALRAQLLAVHPQAAPQANPKFTLIVGNLADAAAA